MSMNDIQRKLYDRFQQAYLKWASVPRPHSKNWTPLSIVATPTYFTKLGDFRKLEWEEYCTARDEYIDCLYKKRESA